MDVDKLGVNVFKRPSNDQRSSRKASGDEETGLSENYPDFYSTPQLLRNYPLKSRAKRFLEGK